MGMHRPRQKRYWKLANRQLRSDTDYAHHSACVPARRSMRKEHLCMAIRASARRTDRRRVDARVQ